MKTNPPIARKLVPTSCNQVGGFAVRAASTDGATLSDYRRPTTAHAPTVLVVDDTPLNLSVLLDLLSGAGFEVLVADSGERALLQVSHRRPDLILLDAMMPGMDGFETCRHLSTGAPGMGGASGLVAPAGPGTAANLSMLSGG